MYNKEISEIATRLAPTSRITVLTGAGVSAASGVPTFRGAQAAAGGDSRTASAWRGFRSEDLATPAAFARDPRLVWEWYDWRRGLIAGCRPNRAHEVLAAWSHRFPGFTLVTQNVDGLHEAAGTRDVIRLHGSIWQVKCGAECRAGAIPWLDETVPMAPLPPRCPHCGGLLRPAVVWFGESLDPGHVRRATAATVCDLFLAVGTSVVVYPAAGLLGEARRRGAFTVEINPEATEASGLVDLAIPEPAEHALDLLERAVAGR